MRLRLRTAEILAVTLLTILVVGSTTLFHVLRVAHIAVEEASRSADLTARQIYAQARRSLARVTGVPPWEALRADPELRGLIETSVSYSPSLVYVALTDAADLVRLHSEPEREGQGVTPRQGLETLLAARPLTRLVELLGSGQTYEVALPLELDKHPFGTIRLGVATSLLRRELDTSLRQATVFAAAALAVAWLLSIGLTRLALQPIRRVTQEVERLRLGATTARPQLGKEDEFQELATQLELLGEQMQASRLRELSEQGPLQQVADQLEDGFVFLTVDQRILSMNKAAEALLDRPAGGALRRPLEEVLGRAHPLGAALAGPIRGEGRLRNAVVQLGDGADERELLVSTVPLTDAQRAVGTMILLKDAGSIKTLRSLVSYSAKLTALGRLTSGVAHEVKNPLNAMAIHLEVLRERLGAGAQEVQGNLDVLQGEIRRLDRAVQGFLRFIRPQELSLKAVDVHALLGRIVSLLAPEWKPRGVRVALDEPAGLRPIMADEELLHQAFLNIALNGCQAMPDGGVLRIAARMDEEGCATVTFSDQGVGIPPADLDRIFALYYTTKPEGSGVGLSVTYRIVQLHDGSIDVISTPGSGTTVTVRLPAG